MYENTQFITKKCENKVNTFIKITSNVHCTVIKRHNIVC